MTSVLSVNSWYIFLQNGRRGTRLTFTLRPLRPAAKLLQWACRWAHIAVRHALHLNGAVVAARRLALTLGDAPPLQPLRAGRVVGTLQHRGPAERGVAAAVPGAKSVAGRVFTGSGNEAGQGGNDDRGKLHVDDGVDELRR